VRIKKLILAMQRSQQGFTRADLDRVADHFGIWQKPGGRHPVKYYRDGYPVHVAVPDQNPIKPTCVRQFLDLIWDLIPDDWRVEE